MTTTSITASYPVQGTRLTNKHRLGEQPHPSATYWKSCSGHKRLQGGVMAILLRLRTGRCSVFYQQFTRTAVNIYIKGIVISTGRLLSEFQVSGHISYVRTWMDNRFCEQSGSESKTHYSNHLFIQAWRLPICITSKRSGICDADEKILDSWLLTFDPYG